MIPFLLITNIVAFGLMGLDKARAQRHKRRIPENTLFLAAACMGAPGGLLGMYVFRHKTRHAKFRIGFPLLLMAEAALLVCIRYPL